MNATEAILPMLFAVDPSPWLAVFGRAHPVLLHAPLGILPALSLLEFGPLLLRREPPRGSVITIAWLGALAAAAAAASGLVLAGEPGYGGEVTGQHKVLGLVLGGLCVLVALLSLLRRRAPMRIALLLALGAMFPTGHLGGTLSHGEGFLTQPIDDLPPADAGEFVRSIQPILKRCCTKCHNPNKLKGDLDLGSPRGITAGGGSGEVVVAGKPDDSELLRLCLLPEDDDDVMPPTGKRPRPTAEELATLRRWIEGGARFD